MMDGWKLVTVNVENANKLMGVFKDLQTQFGLYPLLMAPMASNGAIRDIPQTIYGEEYWDADIADFKSVLVNIHALILDQVRAWSGWFMGEEYQELRFSADMVIKSIDPNKGNNPILMNCYKIWLRRLSSAVHVIAKKHIKRSIYN